MDYPLEKLFVWCFSRMRSKGSRFTLGVWGLRVCSLDVASASATVRNRPQPFVRGPYGRAYGKFCRGGHFWRFQTCRCFVSRGRRCTLWHSDVFCNVLKIVLRGRRNTFVTFLEDVLQFSWQAQHFGRVHRHFSWQAQHFRRVLLRVFCKSHWQGCVKWRQGANSVAGVAFSDMCWKLTEASHETLILRLQIFRFWGKLVGKRRFWSCKVSKLEEVSYEMLVLVLPRVSSRVSGFPVASPCLWGKLQNLSFCYVANCENRRKSRTKWSFWCSHVSRLESLVFLWLRRVYGGSRKTSPFRRFPRKLSCRFAWQAWHFVTFQPVW